MANVLLMDGFDSYDFNKRVSAAPSIHSKWVVNNTGGLSGYGGRFGGQAMTLYENYGTPVASIYIPGNPYIQSGTVAYAFLTNNITTVENHGLFFQIMRDQSYQLGFSMSNIGALRLWRNNTLIAESVPNLIRTMDWHFLEFEYVCHTSTGRVTIYLDGVNVLEFRGNTQSQAAYGFNGFRYTGGSNGQVVIDDFYLIDQPVRIGERRIETLRPNGDVTGNQFTPSSGTTGTAMLNEILVDETTYVSADTAGKKDLYNFTNLSTNPYKIDAVQLNVWATKTDSDTRRMQTIFKSGSTETVSVEYNLPFNHVNLNRIEQMDPATGQPWNTTAVNALQGGYKVSY